MGNSAAASCCAAAVAAASCCTTARITAYQALAVVSIVPQLFAEETKLIKLTGPGNRWGEVYGRRAEGGGPRAEG